METIFSRPEQEFENNMTVEKNNINNVQGKIVIAQNYREENNYHDNGSISKKTKLIDFPKPIVNFNGREDYLDCIQTYFKNSSKNLSQFVVAGMPGVGKTQIVLKYAEKYIKDYKIIRFIESGSPQTLWNSFKGIAKDYQIPLCNINEDDPKSIKYIVDEVFHFVRNYGKILLIYDNAVEPEHLFHYIPRTHKGESVKIDVLVTSRVQEWHFEDLGEFEEKKLDVFSLNEAIKYVNNCLLENNSIEEQIESLCCLMQNLPLALSSAVGYINAENKRLQNSPYKYDIQNYIHDYESQEGYFLEDENSPSVYERTLNLTFRLAIKKIEDLKDGKNAISIFEKMAYFPPDNIPYDFFNADIKDSQLINHLTRYSLVYCIESETDSYTKVYKMHKLIQRAMINYINEKKRQKIVINQLVELLDKHMRFTLNYVCRNGMTEVIEHMIKNYTNVVKTDYNDSSVWSDVHDWKVAKILIDSNKFDLNMIDLLNRTVLMHACRNGIFELVKHISDRDIQNINDRDLFGKTALTYACEGKSLEIIKYLVQHEKIQLNDKDENGMTELMVACQYGNLEILKILLNTEKYDLTETDQCGNSLLSYACKNKFNGLEILKYLFNTGEFDLNHRNNFRESLLMTTCIYGCLDMLIFLIGNITFNMNEKDSDGMTAINYAVYFDQLEMFMFLFEKYESEIDNLPEIFQLAKSSSPRIKQYLLEKGYTIE